MTTQNLSPTVQRNQLLVLVFILLLAAAGRIINIDVESLWVDEGFSYWAIRHPDMLGLLLNDVHPPIYFVMLRGWAGLVGISELALRYLSVLPSLLSVAVVYHVARELVILRDGNTNYSPIPLLAALMLALADMENYIAQETRNYTWHVLWAVVSMWAFLRWQRLKTPRLLGGWVVATILLVYTHYIGVCLVVVQGLYTLLFMRGRGRIQAIAALGIVGLVFVPWLLIVATGQTANIGTGFNAPSTLGSLWNWRIEWFTQQWALMMGLAVVGIVAALTPRPPLLHEEAANSSLKPGKVPLLHEEAANSSLKPGKVPLPMGEGFRVRALTYTFLVVGWLVIPVVLTYILNFRVPILMDYRITQITPAVALLVAFGLGQFRGTVLGFLVAVVVIYGVAIDDTPRPRPPWREVGANAAQYAVEGDLALAHVTPSGDWQVMYYYERFMPDIERRSLRQWQLEDGETYTEGLPALLAEYDHVWFMHWSKDLSGFEALASTNHIQTAVMTEDWLGNDLNVYRFDVLPPQDQALASYASDMTLRDAHIHDNLHRVDLFWSIEVPIEVDYTISAILLDENGALIAQHDAQPFQNQRPTTTWQPDEVVYDPHTLQFTGENPSSGTYTVGVKVYQWTPAGIIDIPTRDGAEFATIGALTIP